MATRRDFLKQAIFLSGASAFSGVLPDVIQRAHAITPDPGTTYLDAEHVVLLMQENRSFDHIFGTLQGVRGFNDPHPIRQADGKSVFLQSDYTGRSYLPWRLNIKDTRITWMGSIPHSRASQVDAWNGGGHNHWIESKRSANSEYANVPITMGHYTREDAPFYYALADAFTICDQHYCGIMSCTYPNRSLFWTGTVRDAQKSDSKVYLSNSEFSDDAPLTWDTFPERLQQAGVNWKFYQNETSSNFLGSEVQSEDSDGAHEVAAELLSTGEEFSWLGNLNGNMLEYFENYNVHVSPHYRAKIDQLIALLTGQQEKLTKDLEKASPGSASAAELHKALNHCSKQLETARKNQKRSLKSLSDLSQHERDLHERAFVTNEKDPNYCTLAPIDIQAEGKTEQMYVPKGDLLHQFRKDVRSEKLPTISWLAPPGMFDDHPAHPWYGPWYVSEVLKILTENPEVWKKTIFIFTYDENDGYFDHAPSFVAADPLRPETGGASGGIETALEYTYAKDEVVHNVSEKDARSGPIGLGFRVPMIIASPWSRGGWVNSELCDQSSTIQFIEKFVDAKYGKKVKETNISPWRRTVCGNLVSNFHPYEGGGAELPFIDRNKHLQEIENARNKPIPSDYRNLERAEVEKLIQADRNLHTVLWQESGTRPSCAIPYQLYADGKTDAKAKILHLRMRAGNEFDARSAGTAFNVYLYGTRSSSELYEKQPSKSKMMAATYSVRSGDELEEKIDLSRFAQDSYDVEIHAPNGFFRHLGGDLSDPALQIVCEYHRNHGNPTGHLELSLSNLSASSCEVAIGDNAYGASEIVKNIAGGRKEAILLDLTKNSSWYDFSVTVTTHKPFLRRYAGHVETGHPSSTDPAMGYLRG